MNATSTFLLLLVFSIFAGCAAIPLEEEVNDMTGHDLIVEPCVEVQSFVNADGEVEDFFDKTVAKHQPLFIAFLEEMDLDTILEETILVRNDIGNDLVGSISYDSKSKIATFMPQDEWGESGELVLIEILLTNGIQNSSGKELLQAPIDCLLKIQ